MAYGTIKWKGGVYEGYYKLWSETPHGAGKWYIDGRLRYDGGYDDGEFDSYGRFYYKSGGWIEGMWYKGKIYEATIRFISGDEARGKVDSNWALHGSVVYTSADGKVEVVDYNHGKPV